MPRATATHRTEPRRIVPIAAGAEHAGGVNVRTLRRWIADGRLTGYRVGPKLLFVDLDELEQMIRPVSAAR
jgi:excisionase family DNA binding protein